MEFKYIEVFYIGIAVALVFLLLSFLYKSRKMDADAVKLANTDILFEDKYYKAQTIKYYILRVILVLSVAFMIIFTAALLARPYYVKKIKEQKYNRDIILCMDISSSVDELNMKLVKELQDTVRSLSGERIGIVIFNTTPVILSPLTDDYEYTIEQLEHIGSAIKSQEAATSVLSFGRNEDWLYNHEYLYGGTLVGNELRGSSLIGDGLLGGLFAFPQEGNNRTKVIIFSTDNDPNGEGYVNLKEAAEYCKRNDTVVYGIGTKQMYTKDMEEMKEAVLSTGGKFFLEENASDFHEIVDEIEDKSAELTEGKTIIKLVESPGKYFTLLVMFFFIFLVASIVLRRSNVLWVLGIAAMSVLLMMTYVYAVIPAKQFSKGPDLEVKRKSNMNVLFVLDNTISMLANDANGSTRLDQLKKDVCEIVDELDGARFSVISFNNDATVLAPFSKDISHVKNAINSINPIEQFYAKGSSFDVPKEPMLNMLRSIKADDEQKTAVFFVSDGEITSEGATLCSYSELAQYVDGGAVLGYGTKAGGTMEARMSYSDTDEVELVMDHDTWPFEPAVSRIDEGNLNSIADDLGISYINMTEGSHTGDLMAVMAGVKSQIKIDEEVVENESGTEYINPPKYYGFYALIPFVILLMLNAAYVVKNK